MKIYLFWCVDRAWVGLFFWMVLVAVPAVAMAQGDRSEFGGAAERTNGRELLAQQIRVDRSDLKMDGEIVLRTLKPLTGELRLQKAQGEPRQIFAGVMRFVPGFKNVFDGLFDVVDVPDLELADLVVRITPEGYQFSLASARIPEGVLERVTGRLDAQKNWQVESGSLRLTTLPLRPARPDPPLPLSYRKLLASGTGQEVFSLEIEKIRVGHLAVLADPSGVLGEYLRAMGFVKGLESSPILFDRFAVKAVADTRQIATQSLVLRAPAATSTGKAVIPWQPEPRKMHVELEVSARKQPVRLFKKVIPLGRQGDRI